MAHSKYLRRLFGSLPLVAPTLLICLGWQTLAEERPLPASATVSFKSDIAPILQRRCVVCHGPEKAKGHFRLDTFATLLRPGSSEQPTVVSGDPEASHVFQLIIESNPDDRMPQNAEPLPSQEIDLIRSWIANGATFDGSSTNAPLASFVPKTKPLAAPERYKIPWPLTALAFTPDGRELIASGYHEATFWDPIAGTLIRRLGGLPERVRALTWQPGGTLLAVVGGQPGRSGEVLLVDPSSHAPPVELALSRDEVLCAAFSLDGARLAVGGTDNLIRVFDLASRTEVLKLDQHSDWVQSIAFSPDGRSLASASRDRTARLCEASSGDVLRVFRDHDAPVGFVVFDADGTAVCSAGSDRRVRLWSADEDKHARTVAQIDSDVTALTPGDHSVFVGLADGRVTQRWLVGPGSEACAFGPVGERITALAFEPEAGWLAVGSHDGRLRLWDVQDGSLVAEFLACPGLVDAPSLRHQE